MVHVSVLERIGVDDFGQPYDPLSLQLMLDVLQSTYDPGQVVASPVKIVNWEGKPMDPNNDSDVVAAKNLISEARRQIAVAR